MRLSLFRWGTRVGFCNYVLRGRLLRRDFHACERRLHGRLGAGYDHLCPNAVAEEDLLVDVELAGAEKLAAAVVVVVVAVVERRVDGVKYHASPTQEDASLMAIAVRYPSDSVDFD
jgi:hypothetical protein